MSEPKIHVNFSGRFVILGFGGLGQGLLPLLLRHIGTSPERISILSAHDGGRNEAAHYGVSFTQVNLTRENYRGILTPLLSANDFLVNVSTDVSSTALIQLAWERGALYLDTCTEPWLGGYDLTIPAPARTNHVMRNEALALRKGHANAPTAIITHGANPGMVSHLAKQALLNIAHDTGIAAAPRKQAEWAALAQRLGVKLMQIAERDTQESRLAKQPGEFVNTWSAEGFTGELVQPAELGWGTHESAVPPDVRHHHRGTSVAAYLTAPGAATLMRTWAPAAGQFLGYCVAHAEAISLADYLSVRSGDQLVYNPTVHYAYHPSPVAMASIEEFRQRKWVAQGRLRVMRDDIVSGVDELGIFIAGHAKNAYWFGSHLSIEQARKAAPFNSATTLQVTAGCLAAVVAAIEDPHRGLIEPEEMDHKRALEICTPYLGNLVGQYTDWTPLQGRPKSAGMHADPWQFTNVRVTSGD